MDVFAKGEWIRLTVLRIVLNVYSEILLNNARFFPEGHLASFLERIGTEGPCQPYSPHAAGNMAS